MNLKEAIIAANENCYNQQGGGSVHSFLGRNRWVEIFNDVIRYLVNAAKLETATVRTFTVTASADGFILPRDWTRIIKVISPQYVSIIPARDFYELQMLGATSCNFITQQDRKLLFGGTLYDSDIQLAVQVLPYLSEDTDELPFGPEWARLIYLKAALNAMDTAGKSHGDGSDARLYRLRNSVLEIEELFVRTFDTTKVEEEFSNPAWTDRLYQNRGRK